MGLLLERLKLCLELGMFLFQREGLTLESACLAVQVLVLFLKSGLDEEELLLFLLEKTPELLLVSYLLLGLV